MPCPCSFTFSNPMQLLKFLSHLYLRYTSITFSVVTVHVDRLFYYMKSFRCRAYSTVLWEIAATDHVMILLADVFSIVKVFQPFIHCRSVVFHPFYISFYTFQTLTNSPLPRSLVNLREKLANL